MNRIDYLIITLLLSTWIAEDIYHLAPRGFWIYPFFFSEKKVTIQRYIHDIAIHYEYIVFIICIYFRKNDSHWLTKDVILMTIFLKAISLIWYLSEYGNPFYSSEFKTVIFAIILIFISTEAVNWSNGKYRDIDHIRGIHRRD